jgi:DNA-binding transcriptional LysR family regulator
VTVFDPRQLRVLAAVAHTGSYTAAAEALSYTQPAISYQMRMLERAAGTALVARAGRGVRLTRAGAVLASHAHVVLAALKDAEAELSALAGEDVRQVRLAVGHGGHARLIPQAVASARRTVPDLEVALRRADGNAAGNMLRRGEVDIAVVSVPENEPAPDDAGIQAIRLLTDEVHILLPAEHPLAAADSLTLTDLTEQSWVVDGDHRYLLDACARAGFTPRIGAIVEDQLDVRSLVAGEIGIALVDSLGYTCGPTLVTRWLRDWPRHQVYALSWSNSARADTIDAVIGALRTAAGRLSRHRANQPSASRA